jgi:hypothetical protein
MYPLHRAIQLHLLSAYRPQHMQLPNISLLMSNTLQGDRQGLLKIWLSP